MIPAVAAGSAIADLPMLLAGIAAGGVRAYAGLMLVVAGAGKLRALPAFEGILGAYRILPGALVPAAARMLPPVEIALGIALLLPALTPLAAPAAAMLLLAFAAAVALNLSRGRGHIDCGCGTGAGLNRRLVATNLLLAALLLATPALPPAPGRLLALGGLVLGAALWLAGRTVASLTPAAFRHA